MRTFNDFGRRAPGGLGALLGLAYAFSCADSFADNATRAVAAESVQSPERVKVARLEEIIVTAQRREESVLDIPLSVSAFTGDALEDIGASELTDFLQMSPGVSATPTGIGKNAIYVRGLSSRNGDSHVGYYLDEIPFNFIGISIVPDVRIFDLERVEVLRGPQGTLYGASSLGGTIRILTRDPVLSRYGATLDVAGTHTSEGEENYSVKVAGNAPIVDDVLGIRAVYTSEKFGGWLDDPLLGRNANESEIETYRTKIRWAPNESIDLVGAVSSYEGTYDSNNLGTDDGLTSINPSGLDYDTYSLKVTATTPWFDFSSSTSYLDYQNPEQSSGISFATLAQSASQEFRLVSNADKALQWVAGIYYRDLETDFNIDEFAIGTFVVPATLQGTTSESYAIYGELHYALSGQWAGTVGGRYFKDKRDRFDTGFNFNTGVPYTQSITDEYTGFAPRFNLAWRPTGSWLVYGNVAKGFRPGVTQPGVTVNTAESIGLVVPELVPEETAWSYELGTKGTIANGRAVIEAAAYYIDWEDLQTVVSVVPGVVGAIQTAGRAESVGIDLHASLAVTDGLTMMFSGNFQDPTYREDVVDSLGVLVSKGQQIVGTPKRTISASALYRWTVSENTIGFARIGYESNSERTALSRAAVAAGESDEITQLSARIGVERGQWSAYLTGENLTDEGGKLEAALQSVPGVGFLAPRLRPRTIGVNFVWQY